MTGTQKKLQPFTGGDKIPAVLKAQNRWAPWRAEFNVKREKWDKIPCRTENVQQGLSTANPGRWSAFHLAMQAHSKAKGYTHGVGYCMTQPHGTVGIDLDGAASDGVVEPWAQEIVERVGGYAEFSPSGKGLRIFVLGTIADDWTNHQIGVEVYAGHHPRFLTVTGRHLPGTPLDVSTPRPGSLDWLGEKYKEQATQKKAKGELAPMPAPLLVEECPAISELSLTPRAVDFLTTGDTGESGDRSRVLHSTAVSLFTAGLNDTEVLSVLLHNPYAFEVALDHRRQMPDRALDYLWQHHVCAGKPKAKSGILTHTDWVDEVERDYEERADEPEANGVSGESEVLAMFDDLDAGGSAPPATKPKSKDRFPVFQAAEYAAQSIHMEWLIPNVLPKAEIVSIFGESGAGKTFFALDAITCISLGLPWWGKLVPKRKVVYIAAEGAMGVRLRLMALAQAKGIDLAQADLHIIPAQPNLLQQDDVKALLKAMNALGKVDVVVLDTIAQVTPGANENSSEDMGKALAHCKTLHQVLGATIVLIGHSGKNARRGQRGWSGIKAAVDAQIEVTKTATYRAATVTKLKDGQGEGAEYLFKLLNVQVGWELDDDPITSCVVNPILSPAQKQAAREEAQKRPATAGGRPAGGGKYTRCIVRAVENLGGCSNKPVHSQRLLDEVTRIIREEYPALKRVPQAFNDGLRAAVKAGDLIHDQDTGTYTLAFPPDRADLDFSDLHVADAPAPYPE